MILPEAYNVPCNEYNTHRVMYNMLILKERDFVAIDKSAICL